MNFGLPATHQALLHNNKVLFFRKGDEARLWDITTGQITPVPAPFPIPGYNIHCAGHVVLADGRVLVVGGQVDGPHRAIAFASIFDPETNTWSQVADMNYARWYPTATMLSDGRVLVTNGEAPDGGRTGQIEVYDPSTDKWTVLAGADRPMDLYSFVYLLPDGRIFNATPSKMTNDGLSSALLDLGTRRWSGGPVAHWRTIGYSESGAMYLPGKVIRSGGQATGSSTNASSDKTEIVDMTASNPAYEVTSPMAFPRQRHNMTILADGTVMAVGGTQQGDDPDQSVLEGEIWDPAATQWSTVAAMAHPRNYHSAAMLLPDGRVLAAGGEPATASETARTAQIFSPPYLFKGPRPTISGAPAELDYGGSFSIATPDAGSIDSVALIRPSAVTHANNMDQRYVPLAFTGGGGELTVSGPENGNWAPPGWYMLVIRNTSGVPSKATWIKVGSGYEPGPGPGPGPGPTPPPPPPLPSSVPAITVKDVKAKEGKKGKKNTLSFKVSLSAKAKSTVTFKYTTADDSAVAGSDYTAKSGTLKIKKGKKSRTVDIKTIGDGTREPDEKLTLVLSEPTGATIDDGEAIGTIANDD